LRRNANIRHFIATFFVHVSSPIAKRTNQPCSKIENENDDEHENDWGGGRTRE
jgi:hypothetical protein